MFALLAWSAATAVAAAPVTTTDFVRQAGEQERAIERCTAWVEQQHAMEFEGNGSIKPGRDLTVVRRVAGVPPSRRIEIVSARRSGQDVADQMRREQKLASETHQFRSPFHPETRPLYMFLRAEAAPSEPMRLSFHPIYSHRDDPGLFEGTALLDRATGRLLEWTADLVHPPTFVTKAQVAVKYGARVGLLDARSEINVDIEGGLLFYRRRGRMEFRFKDYVCPESMPPPAAEPTVAEPHGPPPGPASGAHAERGS